MPKPKGLPKTGGRRVGSLNVATKHTKQALEQLAQDHTEAALQVLVEVMKHGQSDAARVSAANALLDRGYGKPRQGLDHSVKVDAVGLGARLNAAQARVLASEAD